MTTIQANMILVIGKLPTGDLFDISAITATTSYIKGGVYPLITAATTVTKNIVAVSNLNFQPPFLHKGGI